jgi:murein DD-endopeptidase MepM/ murein hydrolase activator NlpD
MLRDFKIFVYSPRSLDLKEIRLFKTKLVGSGLLLTILVVSLVFLAGHFAGGLFGLGFDRMAALSTENTVLKEKIRVMGDKMASVQKSLEHLSDRGNELRQAVDLTRIDDDTRAAATGGATAPVMSAFLSGEAGEVLTNASSLLDRLEHEVKLQQSSYEEITRRMEYNKGLFSHIPAIKPMDGPYSLHGFGMRLHPVLGVYRPHEGIDIINDVGTNIYAAGDGIVHFSGRTAGGYGMVIEVTHGYGYSTLYAHLSKVLVREGQAVKRGELIARCGRSGLVSGPHLHYEVRYQGRKYNPVDFFFDDVNAARYRSQLAAAKSE